MRRLFLMPLPFFLLLSGCLDAQAPRAPKSIDLSAESVSSPPPAQEGRCWARERTPAVFESLIEQSHLGGGSYASQAEQRLVSPPRDFWFETLCKDQMTPELIASLQRALMARGLYDGQINGVMTPQTRAALRHYQTAAGLPSDELSRAGAQHLGLWLAR